MRLSRNALDAYNAAIKEQGGNAEKASRKALEVWFQENPGASVAETREFSIALMNEVGYLYGNAAGDAAYALRDAAAQAAGIDLPDVDYEYFPEEEYVGRAAHYQAGKLDEGDVDGFKDGIADASRYFAERGANDTMTALGKEDGKKLGKQVRFARIPTGATTCEYCCMLASRGFVYHSELTALNANHKHCDCRIVEGFAGMEVEGYDPDYYYDVWKHPEKYETVEEETQIEGSDARQSVETSQAVKDAVEYYASGEGMYVNQFIRRGQYDLLNDEEKQLVTLLDEATKADTVDVHTLYRSVDASSVFGSMSRLEFEQMQDAIVFDADFERRQTQHIIDKAKPGKVITEKGFMSTSEEYDVVSGWYDFTGSDKPITLELAVPNGTKGCKVYELTPNVEADDPQREVLLPRNTRYRIIEVTSKDGLVYVKAEIVAD